MLTRVITGCVLLLLLVPTVWFSETIFLPIVTSLLVFIGILELKNCYGGKESPICVIPAVLCGVGMQWVARYVTDFSSVILCLIFVLLTFEMFCAVFSRGKLSSSRALTIAGLTFYISFGFCAMILLCDSEGMATLPLAFLIPWGSDTMAYFGGYLFGKHKLIPDVSPKKTVEGAIGGALGAGGIAVLYGFLVSLISSLEPSYLLLALSGVSVSVISQCGDLVMSLIKRENGIKDYGSIFPGHGGVLDRFDSILVSAPTLYFIGYFATDWMFFA